MQHSNHTITGKLVFSPRRVILESGEEKYFVRPFSLRDGYVHGDNIKARIVKRSDGDKLSEVEVTVLLHRSEEVLLATVALSRGKKYLEVRREQWTFRAPLPPDVRHYQMGDIIACKFLRDGVFKPLHRFAQSGEYDIEERLILFLSGAHTEFSRTVMMESEALIAPIIEDNNVLSFRSNAEESLSHSLMWDKWSKFSKGDFERDPYGMTESWIKKSDIDISGISSDTKLDLEQPLFFSRGSRIDFRNWYTLTIDGADAKDLDDAISIAPFSSGDILLGVHIADVAEYVREHTEIEKEALSRATSIYTPGRVIPMLPERLSNDLCSLHPGSPKFTLSCLMLVDGGGRVKHTEIVEGIIESREKGVYEEIMNYKLWMDNKGKSSPSFPGIVAGNLFQDSRLQKLGDDRNMSLNKQQKLEPFHTTVSLAFSLYEVLKKRRQKEGKIIFESTEISFQFEKDKVHSAQKTVHTNDLQKSNIPTHILKRERNDAHMMIEEFMVLANEEVAKWCVRHELPFLSRVHGLPSTDNLEFIAEIIGNREARRKLEPHHIREYMERISDPVEQFRLSRLLLPKMAKATYADKPFRHFGLALLFYSHFTSPIRRYPDLQVHRIIKEKLHGELTSERKAHYRNILKRVAKHASERERGADDIERAFDALYACRYMQDKVEQTFPGRISGITEHALYIELESGIEGTCYLTRKKYHVNPLTGSLETLSGKELYRIGQKVTITVSEVDMNEKRIVLLLKEK